MTADAHGQPPHEATEMVHALLGIAAVGELAEAIAARVVELLEWPERRPTTGLATAAEVAEELGVHKSWVYAHQKRLGGVRLGDGPRASLRFDLERARRAVDKERSERQRPGRSRGRPRNASLLPEASSCYADGGPTTETDGTMAHAMPPPRRGSIRRKQTQLGTMYALRIRWQGRQHYHYLGGDWEGWTEERAESELRYVTAQVERGEYVPPKPSAAPPEDAGALPTFHVFASRDGLRRSLIATSSGG